MKLDYSLDVFKEPRGLFKFLQLIFGVCAFVSTLGFTTEYGFSAKCGTNKIKIAQEVRYPFAVNHLSKNYTCGKQNIEVCFVANAKSEAVFFVTTGILSFLYATAVTALHVFGDKFYLGNNKLKMSDFFITVIFAVFWLSGSAAWVKGCSTLQDATDPAKSLYQVKGCTEKNVKCFDSFAGSFAGIIASILFGFINFILWTSNIWFVFKETTWFESMKNTGVSNTAATSSTST